jgi:hypothetical protein
MSAASGGISVNGWEDDPEPAVRTSQPAPDLSHRPLAFAFSGSNPRPDAYAQGTAGFRFWAAASALRRGADFWAPLINPVKRWQPGNTLKVMLDEGEDLNAFYDRNALNFFHGRAQTGSSSIREKARTSPATKWATRFLIPLSPSCGMPEARKRQHSTRDSPI